LAYGRCWLWRYAAMHVQQALVEGCNQIPADFGRVGRIVQTVLYHNQGGFRVFFVAGSFCTLAASSDRLPGWIMHLVHA
jgi:hypothetical protein